MPTINIVLPTRHDTLTAHYTALTQKETAIGTQAALLNSATKFHPYPLTNFIYKT